MTTMSRTHAGFSLIEVLIALLIVSFGMLGVASALLVVHRSTDSSYLQQQGVQLAANIVAEMRANTDAVATGDYDVTYAGGTVTAPAQACDPAGAMCTSDQEAAYDLWQWLTGLQSLPAPQASVVVRQTATGTYQVNISVSWDNTPAASTLKSTSTRRAVQLETLL